MFFPLTFGTHVAYLFFSFFVSLSLPSSLLLFFSSSSFICRPCISCTMTPTSRTRTWPRSGSCRPRCLPRLGSSAGPCSAQTRYGPNQTSSLPCLLYLLLYLHCTSALTEQHCSISPCNYALKVVSVILADVSLNI